MTTDRAGSRAKPGRLSRPLPVAAAAIAIFLILFALLAVRMRAGADPLLGKAAAPKRVIVRKVIQRVEQIELLPAAAPSPPPQATSTSTVSSGPAAAPATRSS